MKTSGVAAQGGFTLVETMVAMALSAVLIVMVSSVFLAQNHLYDDVVHRTEVHDDARSVVDLLAGELHPVTGASFVVADSLQLVLEEPLSLGVVCDVQGDRVSAYFPYGSAGLDTTSVTGYGIRAPGGGWTFHTDTWSGMDPLRGNGPRAKCSGIGFDVTGLDADRFVRLRGPGSITTVSVGGSIMLVRELELRFADSTLDPDHVALYRGTYGETLTEFATGLGSEAHFAYRLKGEDTFSSPVSSSDLTDINGIRVEAHAVSGDEGAGLRKYEYRITRDITLRNEE